MSEIIKNTIKNEIKKINVADRIKLTEIIIFHTQTKPQNWGDKSIIIDEILENQLAIMKLLKKIEERVL